MALIKSYLDDLRKQEVVNVGVNLGLDSKLGDVEEDKIRVTMIERWLKMHDYVEKNSGTPTLEKLVTALKQNGYNGVAMQIEKVCCYAVIQCATL